MTTAAIIVIIAAAFLAAAIVRCIWELHNLKVTRYTVKTAKTDRRKKAVFLSDLHGRIYGAANEKLIELVKNENPDVILVGGDMTVARYPERDETALHVIGELSKVAPVFYAPGNHECGIRFLKQYRERWAGFLSDVNESGARFISNEKLIILGEDSNICLGGLDLDYKFYRKVKHEKAGLADVEAAIGKFDEKSYNILLAHDPASFEEYEGLGADLILAGHYHGGAVRLFGQGVISPQFRPFPKYSFGRFAGKKGATMIVTAGCGSHTVNLRLFNRPEIVSIMINPED